MDPRGQLSEGALKVLNEVRDRSMDGYTVMYRTRLSPADLETAVRELVGQKLLEVKGELYATDIGEAVLYVPPQAKGYADFVLGRLLA